MVILDASRISLMWEIIGHGQGYDLSVLIVSMDSFKMGVMAGLAILIKVARL